jgi:hypothetical protein
MDANERALLDSTVRDALDGAAGQPPAAVDKVLGDLGWLEMLAAEPRDAVGIVFGALGATNLAATAIDDVMLAALGIEPRPDLAICLPAYGTWDPPGRVGTGVSSGRAATAKELVVLTGLDAVTIPVEDAALSPLAGIDPAAELQLVYVEANASRTTPIDGPAEWAAAVAAGRLAIAHQVAGACRAMLDLARTHAVDRVQFGRPIARFQAVRHRLAEALVAIEALDAVIDAAWDEPGPMTSALAKAFAGRASRTVGTQCQQVLAGIGFTTDHAFHRYLKRTMLLDGLFGSSDDIVVAIGHELLDTRFVPTLIEL